MGLLEPMHRGTAGWSSRDIVLHEAAAEDIDEATVLDLVMAGSLLEGEEL